MSRLRANQITNENANGAPNFPHGLTVTGIVTASTLNQTPTSIVVGSAVTANSQGIDVTGIVTATSFKGAATNLTSIPAANLTGTAAAINGSNITNLPAANLTGVLPAISGANLTGIDASQIVKWSYNKTSTGYSISNTASYTDFTAWNVTITPASTSNRIILIANTHLESKFSGSGGSGTVIQWQVSTDGGSSYGNADNGNVAARGWNGLNGARVGSNTTLVSIHAPANTNEHRFRMRGRTGGYSNTESWFGNNCDTGWWGSGQYIRSHFYAIEFKPNA